MIPPSEHGFSKRFRQRDCLTPFAEAGILDDLDVTLARRLVRLAGLDSSHLAGGAPDDWTDVRLLALAAALASRGPRYGHVCVNLRTFRGIPVNPGENADAIEEPLSWPSDVDRWLAVLQATPGLVQTPGNDPPRPLVLDADGRLYLHRYWRYEERLASWIRDRIGRADPAIDLSPLMADLDVLLPLCSGADQTGNLGQRLAAFLASVQRFAILTGGPGTGKTSVVSVLVLLLMRQRQRQGRAPLRVLLAAPTGKAAARMTEAIRKEIEDRQRGIRVRVRGSGESWDPAIDSLLNLEAFTIHRALGMRPDDPTRPRHSASNPLPADLVILDEASMVDLALLTRLVEAVPPDSRIVLLGDRDQLASIEAGAVLADLSREPGATVVFSPRMAADISRCLDVQVASDETGPTIRDCVANLEYSFRSDVPGILGLSRAIRVGDVPAALAFAAPGDAGLPEEARRGVRWISFSNDADLTRSTGSAALQAMRDGFRDGDDSAPGLVQAVRRVLMAAPGTARIETTKNAIEALNRFRVLCVHRKGPRGVETVNRLVREGLRKALNGTEDWYAGRPVLILRNDYTVRLFNGDTGLVLPDPRVETDDAPLVAVFPDSREPTGLRFVPRGRLPPHESVFAMTIHKSQGSQFDRVLLLLPRESSDFLTRELVYTGVTRAKREVWIAGDAGVFGEALKRRVERASGLRERLWGA